MPDFEFFMHMNWTTGRSLIQDPSFYSASTSPGMAPHAAELAKTGRSVILGFDDVYTVLRPVCRGFVASVYKAIPLSIRVVTFGYAADEACAAEIWREVTNAPTIGIAPDRLETPCCTAALNLINQFTTVSVAAWVGDYQRCLVFAWQERAHPKLF